MFQQFVAGTAVSRQSLTWQTGEHDHAPHCPPSWFQPPPWGAGSHGAGRPQASPTEECYGSSRPLLTPPDPTWLPRSPSSLFAWAFNSDWGPRRALRHPKMAAARSLSGSAPWRPPRPPPAFPPAGPGWGGETPAWRPLGLCSKWRAQSYPQCWSKHGVPHRDVHSPHSWGRSDSSTVWLGGSRPGRQGQIVLVSKCNYNRGKEKFKTIKDGDNTRNHQDSSPKYCNSRIIGVWCQSWLICTLSLKTSNCRLQLLREQVLLILSILITTNFSCHLT